MATEIDLSAFRRVPFGGASGEADIVIAGFNWASATFAMMIRAHPGDTGTPLVSLTTTTAGSQGLSATFQASYALPDDGGIVPATILRPQIDASTLTALPTAAETDEPLELYYDLHVTPSGSSKFVLLYGKFLLMPGVTT